MFNLSIIKNLLVRLYTVSPQNIELYALRLLLLNTPGPTRYEDLKTVGKNPPCATFAKAAELRGLLDSDENWMKVMQDAVNEKMKGTSLIRHFAQLLYFQPPVDPELMLEEFLDKMLPQPLNAQDKEESKKKRKETVLRKLEYYLSKFGSCCMYVVILKFICYAMFMYTFTEKLGFLHRLIMTKQKWNKKWAKMSCLT